VQFYNLYAKKTLGERYLFDTGIDNQEKSFKSMELEATIVADKYINFKLKNNQWWTMDMQVNNKTHLEELWVIMPCNKGPKHFSNIVALPTTKTMEM